MKTLFLSLAPNAEERGHGIVYQACLEKSAHTMGLPFEALFPKHLPVQWTPFFSHKPLQRLLNYCSALRRAEKKIVFLESFSGTDLALLTLASLFSKKQDRLCLLLRYGLKEKKGLYLFFCKALQRLWKERLFFFTDSELLAREYQEHLDKAPTVLPIPHTETVPPKTTSSSKISCWWPGAPRAAKGHKEIERFASDPKRDPHQIELIAAKQSQLPRTTLVSDVLSREEYLSHLQHTDFLLLPYDPEVYKLGTSGPFVEAIVAGKMPLVKEGSWLAYELKKYNLAELIVDWEDNTFCKRLSLLKDDPEIQAKLKNMQKSYLAFHTQQTFTNLLATRFL